MLRVAVISRAVCELLINGGLLSVSIVPSIAFRQGARVAGATVNPGRHRRSLLFRLQNYALFDSATLVANATFDTR